MVFLSLLFLINWLKINILRGIILGWQNFGPLHYNTGDLPSMDLN